MRRSARAPCLRTVLLVGALAGLAGCSADEAPGAGGDAGATIDAAALSDAGSGGDAGSFADAGAADAGAEVPPQSGIEVTLDSGRVRGSAQGGLRVFKGIPYAAPPTGALRFAPPVPTAPWDGRLDAEDFGPSCPQPKFGPDFLTGGFGGPQSEDCLSVNVWAHDDEAPLRPVMVWIYGGGFVTGSAAWPLYDMAQLAERGDVVMVSLNYRVGALGFLTTDTIDGNMGLQDQILALDWVRRNIRAFGGDPDRVTVFGESAGAISVCALLGAPSADGLFQRAIIQSGLCQIGTREGVGIFGSANARDASAEVIEALECDDAADVDRCLRNLSVEDLVDAVSITSVATGNLDALAASSPHVDGALIPDQPIERLARGDVDKPLIVGSNAREGILFTAADTVLTRRGLEDAIGGFVGNEGVGEQIADLYPSRDFPLPGDAWIAFLGDVSFICHGVAAARAAASGQPAYAYHFTRSPLALRAIGAGHAVELPYVFGTFDALLLVDTPADRRVRDEMQAAWLAFARGEAMPDWPAYDPAAPTYRIFDDPPETATELRNGRCDDLRALGVVP